jgi:hypothetical protein
MKGLIRYGAAVLSLGCGFTTPSVYACTCAERPSMKAAQYAVDVVFRGTIAGRSAHDAVFQVERVWKGRIGERFRVEWKVEDGDCSGFRYEHLKVGADLLVFAKRGSDGVYRTNICYPTKSVAEAAAEVAELGPGERPASH